MDLSNLNNERKNRKKGSVDISTMVYGKIPPQARDMEMAVLGAVMLDRQAYDVVSEILSADCFYVDAHQRIFTVCTSLSLKSIPIDELTVMQELIRTEQLDMIGGPHYLVEITKKLTGDVISKVDHYARIVLERYVKREIIRISGELIHEAYGDGSDPFDLLDDAETKLDKISNRISKSDYVHIGTRKKPLIDKILHLREQDTTVTGVPTMYPEMDKITHGWQNTDMIVLAARPSVGKTAFALNLAMNAATNTIRPTAVGFFSLEMSTDQLVQRITSAGTGVYLSRIATGRMDDHHLQQLVGFNMNSIPIYVDDTAGLSLVEFKAKANRMVKKHGVGLIIIDYLQLMSGDGEHRGNREQEISKISRTVKKKAKDLGIPIIALSQLSRAVETRGTKGGIPQLSDLRESGAIEQDADIVMFLYRPNEDDRNADAELRNKGMLKIAKHRNGELESFAFEVSDNVQQWKEIGILTSRPVSYTPSPGIPGNFRPIKDITQPKRGSGEFDEGFDEQPF